MIIVNNLCDFHDLYTSLSVTFVMYFNRRNKDILFLFIFSLEARNLVCLHSLVHQYGGYQRLLRFLSRE